MSGVRLSLYAGNVGSDSDDKATEIQRNPCLRVYWKPDILRLTPQSERQLKEYVHDFLMKQPPDRADDETLTIIGALVDLSGHKNPAMRVLELEGGCNCKTKQWLDMLGNDTSFPRYGAWISGSILDDGAIAVDENERSPFDVLVVPSVSICHLYTSACIADS